MGPSQLNQAQLLCQTLSSVTAATLFQGYNGPFALSLAAFHGFTDLLRFSFLEAVRFHEPWRFRDTINSTEGFSLSFVALITLLRLFYLGKARVLLSRDQKTYDAAYEKLMDSDGGRALLDELDRVVERACPAMGQKASNMRQCNRLRIFVEPPTAPPTSNPQPEEMETRDESQHPLWLDLGVLTAPGVKDSGSRVTSFNQLYCQGAVCIILLMERIKEWADVSAGMLLEKQDEQTEATYTLWSEIKNDSQRASRCVSLSSRMKRHERCIEKLLRSYNNDISRLLDLTRTSIVFKSLQDLILCFRTIADDASVVIERVKNRLSPAYESKLTAGYRDVCINLRMVGAQAQALGSELHLCEVQLLLLEFAELKTVERRKRFAAFTPLSQGSIPVCLAHTKVGRTCTCKMI